MLKAEARQKYRKLRQQLSEDEIENKSLLIANKLLQLPVFNQTYYHLFLSIEEQNEVNTNHILTILQAKDKEVVVAKTHFESNSLTHFLLTENTLIKKNKYNIPEPVNGLEVPVTLIDVVFVPLLAFDKKGHRIGYGKGFYDRFLAQCRPETLKIGLSFFEAEEKFDDVEETDIPLDYCITPNNIYAFS